MPAEQSMAIDPLHTDVGDFRLKFFTRSDTVEGFESSLPRELCIEVTGPVADLQSALNLGSAIANDFARQMAFLANAWHGMVNLHLAFDSATGGHERDFAQNWISDEVGLPRVARIVKPDLMARAITALSSVHEKERPRLSRAIRQYTDALRYWRAGQELYALSCLYMGVEAITNTVVNREVARRGLKDRSELPKIEGDKYPEAWIRREIIFQGDADTYKTAKEASDGLEHGYASLAEVHEKAVTSMEKTARYLRESMLSLLTLNDADRQALNEKPYATPAKTGGYERMIFGTISNTEQGIAAPGQDYPFVRWEFQLKDFALRSDGAHKMKLTQNLTAFIGTGAQFSPKRVRLAGTTETTHTELDVKVSNPPADKNAQSPAGIEVGVDEPDAMPWPHPVGSLILNVNVLPALALFWLQKLTNTSIETLEQESFEARVAGVGRALAQAGVPEELRSRASEAWSDGLSLDELRKDVACARTQPEGLVIQSRQKNGQSPLISDPKQLEQWNAEVVDLVTRLSAMLDEVLATGLFPDTVAT